MIKTKHTVCCDLCGFEIVEVDKYPTYDYRTGTIINEHEKVISIIIKERENGMPFYKVKYFCRDEHKKEWLARWKKND